MWMCPFIILGTCGRIIDPSLTLHTHLPEIRLEIDHENLTTLSNNLFSDRYVAADLTFNDKTYFVEIRHQGHASRAYYKKSYKIKFSDEHLFQDKHKKIVLSAQLRDPSFMRYILSLKLFLEAGLMTLEAYPVTLFINKNFKGIYLLVEIIDEYFFHNRSIPLGNLYKAVEGNARFSFSGGYNVRYGFEKKIFENNNYTDLEDLLYILDTVPDENLRTEVEKILNVENALNYLAVSVLISNWDGFKHNFYFFNNPIKHQFEFIPWDLDLTFGYGMPPEHMTIEGQIFKESNYLFQRLLEIHEYRQTYKKKLLTLMDGPFSLEALTSNTEEIFNNLVKDYSEDKVIKSRGHSLREEVNKIHTFVINRQKFILEQLSKWQ